MAKASSINISSLTQRRKCPCGDTECHLRVDTDEDKNINNNSNNITYESPHISCEEQVPYIGQTFNTAEEGQEIYGNFARLNGFAIRTERSKGNPNHPLGVYKRELVCHRAGMYRPRKTVDPKRQRNKKSNRCNCEAGMIIKKTVSNSITRWVIVQFNNTHNHELLDNEEVKNLPAYRNISSIDRDRILNLAKTGCTVSQIMRTLEIEKGVKQGDLTFTERDLRNFLQAAKNLNIENEGMEILNVCKEMKERDNGFNFEFSEGNNGSLDNICFTYGECICAYEVFGDVAVFDTTYRLYWYDKTVGVFFGVDNYGNALCFGCALLDDESTSSYSWALQSFVRLMDGKSPQTILTDIDISLKDAISTSLPNTKHVFASWYILSKLPSWFSLSLGVQFQNFVKKFQKLDDFDNLEEFTDQWGRIVSEFRLSSDKHVNLLSYYREYWTLPFLRGWFLGGLSVDFEAKIWRFFRGFSGAQTRLRDFVKQLYASRKRSFPQTSNFFFLPRPPDLNFQFSVALSLQNQAREESTILQNHQNAPIKTCMPMEEHLKSSLTPYAFNLFQKELVASTQFAVYETHPQTYLARHRLEMAGGSVVRCDVVSYEFLRCSCKEFESSGILCRHALRVLSLKNCFSLPDQYLLARWRRESALFPKSSGYKFRLSVLHSLVSIITRESSVTKERFSYAQWHMSKLLSHVRDMPTIDENETECSHLSPVRVRGRPRKRMVNEETSTGEELEGGALEGNGLDMQELHEKELWETHELFGTQDI